MLGRVTRLGLAGALAALAFGPVTASHADCADPVRVACAVVCFVPTDATHRLCTVL